MPCSKQDQLDQAAQKSAQSSVPIQISLHASLCSLPLPSFHCAPLRRILLCPLYILPLSRYTYPYDLILLFLWQSKPSCLKCFHNPSLQYVHVSSVLGSSELDIILQMHLSSAQKRGRSISLDLLATLLDAVGHLCCKNC